MTRYKENKRILGRRVQLDEVSYGIVDGGAGGVLVGKEKDIFRIDAAARAFQKIGEEFGIFIGVFERWNLLIVRNPDQKRVSLAAAGVGLANHLDAARGTGILRAREGRQREYAEKGDGAGSERHPELYLTAKSKA